MEFFTEGCFLPAFQEVWCTNATFPPSLFPALGKGTNPANPWRRLLESKRPRLESLDEFRDSLGREEHIPSLSQEQHCVGVKSLNPWKQQHSKQNSRMAPCPKNPQGNPGGFPRERRRDWICGIFPNTPQASLPSIAHSLSTKSRNFKEKQPWERPSLPTSLKGIFSKDLSPPKFQPEARNSPDFPFQSHLECDQTNKSLDELPTQSRDYRSRFDEPIPAPRPSQNPQAQEPN